MDIKLIMANAKGGGQDVPVTGPRFFIGRAEDCQLRPRSDLISRHHCVILVEEGFVAVRDFGSKNGTYVNGERITSEAELRSGDILKVGPVEFQVQIGPAAATQAQVRAEAPTRAETPRKPEPAKAEAAKPDSKAGELHGKKKPKVHSVQEAAARTVQSSSAPEDEDDVSNWLNDDEVGSTTETTTLEPTKAAKAAPPSKAKPAPEPEDDEFADEEEEEQKPRTKSSAFESPGSRRGATQGNTKDSAANALKNFFHRR